MAKPIQRTLFLNDDVKDMLKHHAEFNDKLGSDELISVFKPLKPKLLEELELIREVSRDLQKKKDEEMSRLAAAKAEEAEEREKAKKETEVKEVKDNESA